MICPGNNGSARGQPGNNLGKGQVLSGRCILPAFRASLLVNKQKDTVPPIARSEIAFAQLNFERIIELLE